jgi:integrase/recombinase XerD
MSRISVVAALKTFKPRKDKTCSIVIRVILDSHVISTQKTNKYVLPEHWDSDKRQVKKSHPNAFIINMLIGNRTTELTSKLDRLELEGKPLSPLNIKNIVIGKKAGYDFFAYCNEYIPVKFCEARQKETRRSYNGELTKLRKFQASLNFYDIDQNFLQRYRAYMLTELNNHPNTVWKTFKFMKSIFNAAIREDKFQGENPFNRFDAGKYRQGLRNYLELDDCDRIMKVLSSKVPEILQHVGYYYLFMCYSGLRYSDALRFDTAIHIIDNERIQMRTQKSGQEVNLFIHSRLRKVLDYIGTSKLTLVNKEFNKYLKVLGTMALIDVPLTAHVGRHTFGAMLAEMETPKEVAQKLLGHADARSTNIYYHLKDKSMDNAMKAWDRL